MATIFEHIVSRRLSQQYEDVATDALAFILDRDEAAREALVELLRSAQPHLSPSLMFDSGRAVFVTSNAQVTVGVDLQTGVEQDAVIAGIVDQLVVLQQVLANVPPTSDEAVPYEAKA